MSDEPGVIQLVTEVLDSGRSPEEVCRICPNLLDEVRRRVARCRRLVSRLDDLFSPPDSKIDQSELPAKLPNIPQYQVLAVIGQGGMGVVYSAQHLKLKRVVALKMLLSGAYASPAELGRFALEAEAIAGLQHPSIVQIHDLGEVDGRPYFTMEYLEGGSLAQKLDGAPLPPEQATRYLVTMASAVDAAHRAGIVHRDLKPANVLFSLDGQLKISDFGLARRISADENLTLSGARVGTPSYMPPEQAAGRAGAIGPSADIYALGAILYEMLTGRPPFRGSSAADTERQVIHDEPAAPRRVNTSVPRDLETICLKCLQKDPRRRYPSVAELGNDLARLQRGEPILARQTGIIESAFKWLRRHPAISTGIAGTALVLGLVLGVGVWVLSQRASAASAIDRYIKDAVDFQKAGNWAGADAAMEHASLGLKSVRSVALSQRLELVRNDSQLVKRLNQIHLQKGIIAGSKDDYAATAQAYAAAFSGAGLGTRAEPPATVANRISRSTVYPALIDALDDWAISVDGDRADWVIDVARIADLGHTDPGSWRRQARDTDPKLWLDRTRVIGLINTADVKHESVALLLLLTERAIQVGSDPLPFLKQMQAAHPDDYFANLALGNRLVKAHDGFTAVRFYQAAIALYPDAAFAHLNLGMSIMGLNRKQPDEAIAQLREAVRIRPDDAQFHRYLGYALCFTGKYKDAIPDLEFELKSDPDDCVCHLDLAECYAHTGQPERATQQYRLAIGLAPAINKAQAEMRQSRIQEGFADQLQVDWKMALRGDQSGYEARKGYAELSLLEGDKQGYQLERAYLLNQFRNSADVAVGEACLLSSEPGEMQDRAVAVVARAAEHAGADDPAIRFTRALCEYRQSHARAAIILLEPEFPPELRPSARILLAMAQFGDGQTDLARKTFSDAVQGIDWNPAKSLTREQWVSQVLRRQAEAMIKPSSKP